MKTVGLTIFAIVLGIEQLRRVGGEGYFYCFAAK